MRGLRGAESNTQLDLLWRQRVDKELTWHQQMRQGVKPPDPTPAPWHLPRSAAPDVAVKATGRRHAPNIGSTHPPPFALLDEVTEMGKGIGTMAMTARAITDREHARATTVAPPVGTAAGTPSCRHPWHRTARPPPQQQHRPPQSAVGSVRSVGSFHSHCTSFPRPPSQLSARTTGSATHARLEALERLFLDEREARLRLEAQLSRVEGQQVTGSRLPTHAHQPTFY